MSKKFTKTILSSAVAGLMLVSSGAMALDIPVKGSDYLIRINDSNNEMASIIDKSKKTEKLGAINTTTGSIMAFNKEEFTKGAGILENILKKQGKTPEEVASKIQGYLNSIAYPVYLPELKLENIKSLNVDDIKKIQEIKKNVSEVVTSANSAEYLSAIRSGGNTEAYLAINKTSPALSKEYSRISGNIEQLNKDTTFAIDANGNITLDETGSVERESVKNVVAAIQADTTIYQNKDGSYTLDQSAPGNVRVNDAVVSLDNRTRSNTQAIQNHSRQLQEHNARLNSQQRQIRENHEEMKRAAAQSAALSGLFQPYSVGKFNATAALGGYSDKQAVAVGVGYRFNEQTAAKAGIAASDGDVSYNVGVNFEF
ncbi:YadA C-terminal domain-containing protein [Escherichia coli]|uniref:YadA C-terminal domain-containing protein n=2 Tax=Escherichia coli TaxID=562 RepID=UPI0022FD88AD|nr:YadA C-terminal domain-containing protein [Escherichia coli]WBY95268.1 YadA C-terminal domain-containing protein [Escherichia coli]